MAPKAVEGGGYDIHCQLTKNSVFAVRQEGATKSSRQNGYPHATGTMPEAIIAESAVRRVASYSKAVATMRRSCISGSADSCWVLRAICAVRSTSRNPGAFSNKVKAAVMSKTTRCFSAITTSSAKTRGETMISCSECIAPSRTSRAKGLSRSEPDQYHARAWVSAVYRAIV